MMKFILITLVYLICFGQICKSQKSNFEHFLNFQIKKAIRKGQLNPEPLLIIQGLPIDSTSRNIIYKALEIKDVKELSVLDSKKASNIFDGKASNGVILVVCNRKGKRKLKALSKNQKRIIEKEDN